MKDTVRLQDRMSKRLEMGEGECPLATYPGNKTGRFESCGIRMDVKLSKKQESKQVYGYQGGKVWGKKKLGSWD